MAREDTRSKRRDDDDEDDDEKPLRGRSRNDDEDDDEKDEPKARRSTKGSDDNSSDVSFDDEDAIEIGLFASGPATIVESVIDRFKFGDRGAFPAWIITYERDGEKYEQPYSIGTGWDLKNGKLIAKNGQKGLAKSCNAIRHLVKPFKAACVESDIEPLHLNPTTMRQLEGSTVVVERVAQEQRHFKDRDRQSRTDRDRSRGRVQNDDEGPTILEIREIVSASWLDGKATSTKAKADKAKVEEEEEDDEEEAPKPTAKGATKKLSDEDLEEEAIEALIAVIEEGPVKMGEPLEEALEAHFKGRKGMGAVVDLASSKKFLATEQGWSFDGKTVDAPKKRSKK